MAKFNTKTTSKIRKQPDTVNRAGGLAYKQSDELAFVSLLLSTFLQAEYYRTGNQAENELRKLALKVNPEFAMKAAIFARDRFGMRSTSHVVASEVARYVGLPKARNFFSKVVVRPDDMLEIVGAYSPYAGIRSNGKIRLPEAMKKGFKNAFNRFNNYQIAKYRRPNHDFTLLDLVNLVRPIPTEKNSDALQQLVADTLRSEETWETTLVRSGQEGTSKKDSWKTLVKENKLNHMALVRNLRNIAVEAPEVLDLALSQLMNEGKIKASRMFPWRYFTAYMMLKDDSNITSQNRRKITAALSYAVDVSCENIPVFDNTLVVVDCSGSMDTNISNDSVITRNNVGAFMGASLAKAGYADIVLFASGARYFDYTGNESVISIVDKISKVNGVDGHGTNFEAIFETVKQKYDRIVIFSDMQGWESQHSYWGGNFGQAHLDKMNKRLGSNPWIYSVDLAGYGSMQFPEHGKRVITMAGYSDKMFELMEYAELDPKVLLNEIRKVQL